MSGERSIAEIIDWQYPMDGGCPTDYTVDDLFDWLSEHVRDGGWDTEGEIGIRCHQGYAEVQWYSAAGIEMVTGRTLLAALEHAVRAVAT
jgi:hypothetical protein